MAPTPRSHFRPLLVAFAALALAAPALMTSACDSDEEDPAVDMSEMDTTEDAVEMCPEDGGQLQVAPILATLNPIQAGETTTQLLQVNNGGDENLCFDSNVVSFDPAVDGLRAGDITLDGSPVTSLAPGQRGQLEITFSPTESGSGTSTLTVSSANGGEADVTVDYSVDRMQIDVDPVGNLVTNVNIGHSLDPTRWDEMGYRTDNDAEMMNSAAFNGQVDSEPVPSLDTMLIRTYLWFDDETGDLTIRQEGYQEMLWETPEARPFVAIHLPAGTYATEATVLTDPTLGDGTGLAVLLSLDANSGLECASGIALGELTIPALEEDPIDGGLSSIQVRSGVLDVFSIDNTPFGDLSADVEGYGYTLCD